jgi:hypothetical protein
MKNRMSLPRANAIVFSLCIGVLLASRAAFAGRGEVTPEATIRGACSAMNIKDWKGMFSRVEGAKATEAASAYHKYREPQGGIGKVSIRFSMLKIVRDTATIHVKVDVAATGPNSASLSTEDDVRLHRARGDWKIVGGSMKNSFFDLLTQLARHPETMTPR